MAKTNEATIRAQEREADFFGKVRQHGRRYEEFHWASVELLINLAYTYDVTVTKLAQHLNAYGLSLSAFNILMNLSRSEGKGCVLRELSDQLVVSRANITGLVDCLVERGLVKRLESKEDRRARIALITPEGEELLEKILPEYYATTRDLLSGLSKDEKAALSKLLVKMRGCVRERVGAQ